ncbi:MAG: TonB-dependent receptor [Sphingomonadaceae bacterium]
MLRFVLASSSRLALVASVALLPQIAAAAESPQRRGDHHNPAAAEIIVTAPFARNRNDILSGTTVMQGADLVQAMRPTLGETLERTPGVSATSFGPNASRPVLRGFQGERVRVLTDGIGSFDVSNTSVDHAVTINPLTAERIEVLRGPSVLLYGSSAIGGVVNVIDARIPRVVPDEPFHIHGIAGYGSAAEERKVSAASDVRLSPMLVAHVDASYTKTEDLRTGGYILSPALRREAAVSDEAEIAENADLKDRLPNTAGRTWDVAGGLALINEGGTLGFSVSHLDSRYGVPSRLETAEHEHEESEEEEEEGHAHEDIRIALKQTRADLRAGINIDGSFLSEIKLRAGFADYQHNELEPSGEIGTTFNNTGYEARLELVQAEHDGWRGAVGGQMLLRDFDVVGEEKFVPRNTTRQLGLFTLQEFDLGAIKAEAGARYENSVVRADADADLGNPDIRRSFSALSASLGASVAIAEGWRVGVSGSRAERAPSAEELFANGPHAGTQAFEVGDPAFAKEKSWSVEATLRGQGEGYSLSLAAFHSWFDNYIYETPTGAEIDELPVYQYAQADARYYGFEAEASVDLAKIGDYTIAADAIADHVRAKVVGSGPAPRIPALRLLGGIEARSDRLTGRIEAEWVDDQKRVSAFETTTDGYTMVNASIAFHPFADNRDTTLILSANNIFDVNARRHASFLKDYAPLAGRDLRISARFSL